MKIVIKIFLLFFSYCVHGQKVDYLDIRDELIVLSCSGPIDSADVFNSIRNLETLDTTAIRKNIHVYYEDLGVKYWLASLGQNRIFLEKSISANQSALYHKPKDAKALWSLAFAYGLLKDCEMARHYFKLYRDYLPHRLWGEEDEKGVSQVLALCN